ncbi:AIP3-domain-containing protein, partial [Tothia fuscella]
PQQQLHQIEKSVTHLLVATKQLLETLTQWSRGSATEGEVSDVYVRLGYEFNIACRAFNAIGVDTNDLGPVPDLLRAILEDTLSQEASQASLDRYLPRIRDIIINLLQGLKKKQAKLRARAAKDTDRTPGGSVLERQGSYDSLGSEILDTPNRTPSGGSRPPPRQGSRDMPPNGPELPPRTTSRNEGRSSPNYGAERFDSRGTIISQSDSTMSSKTAQEIPVIAPYPQEDMIPTGPQTTPQPPPHTSNQSFPHPPPPPPPPPKQQDALLQLQRGGDLERRASRRFSTYQIKQQLGGAANGIPMIPTSQNSPIPNRGREVRESIQAVRQRGSTQYNRAKSERRLAGEPSPNRNIPSRISEESTKSLRDLPEPVQPASPLIKTTEDKLGSSYVDQEAPKLTATLSGPLQDIRGVESPSLPPTAIPARRTSRKAQTQTPPPDAQQYTPEDSPQPGKPLTLFLQYKSKVKKIILEDGSNDLSVGRLQLAFIDKFAWNTHSEGIDLPDIYIQDSTSGVRYELDDLNDIKNNTVLVLNVESLDEVKRHIDDGLSNLRRVVEGIKTAVEDQQSAIQRVGDRQQETAREIAGFVAAPPTTTIARVPSSSNLSALSPTKISSGQLSEIQTLRRDLAVMRQTYSSFASDITSTMAAVRTKAASVKSVAIKVALPSMSGESGRVYINKGLYDTLPKDQTTIVERVDDLQDCIEDLRKDVVTRGVRPLPRQLEQVAKDLAHATAEVKRLETYLTREKPLWTKIWKQELQQVCDDKEAVADSGALIHDMRLDLDEAEKTFRLVEEACKQQNLMANETPDGRGGPRQASGGSRMAALNLDQSVDPRKAKDGVLGEVKGLQIDHDSRLEAIARAERARQKELESRKDGPFKLELSGFVEEGKLKKTGGVEEAERLRKVKDERIQKEVWER